MTCLPWPGIWNAGWHDGHEGRVPDALVSARDPESFRARAAQRVGDATVAVTSSEVAGFVMVASDEVEQMCVASTAPSPSYVAGTPST